MGRHAKSYARENTIKLLYSNSIEKKTKQNMDSKITDQMALKWSKYIIQNEEEINNIIKPFLKKWSISELNPINLAIMQVAIYEFKYDDTPIPIIINESLEFAKKYSDDNSRKFINYVLKEVYKEIRND